MEKSGGSTLETAPPARFLRPRKMKLWVGLEGLLRPNFGGNFGGNNQNIKTNILFISMTYKYYLTAAASTKLLI